MSGSSGNPTSTGAVRGASSGVPSVAAPPIGRHLAPSAPNLPIKPTTALVTAAPIAAVPGAAAPATAAPVRCSARLSTGRGCPWDGCCCYSSALVTAAPRMAALVGGNVGMPTFGLRPPR
uniref:Uncharacterized protein n=1 Tax=Grammatophora oceanica TaxID=210454 RepID=A0A6U5ML20_9STRA|mmetsp:Transcript_3871/g.5296  ORF Transcript_3871/g.5296 Transcript_3871/m.5296 type:complete len:120 (+) Transcript_3871:239-598(+)